MNKEKGKVRSIRAAAMVLFAFFLLVFARTSVRAAADEPIPPEGEIGKIQKKIGALRAWRIADELGFDEKTNLRLLTFLQETDGRRIRIEAGNRAALRILREEMGSPDPDQRRVGEALDRLIANRREQSQMEENHLRQVREILSPVDAARYLLFELRFQREIRERVGEAVRERRRMRGEMNEEGFAPGGLPPGRGMGAGGRGR